MNVQFGAEVHLPLNFTVLYIMLSFGGIKTLRIFQNFRLGPVYFLFRNHIFGRCALNSFRTKINTYFKGAQFFQ
jgi:hypothetical protein